MSQSTNGELWYGVVFEDGYEFPWDAKPFDGDIDDWWLKECGFSPSREINNSDGSDYAGGVKPEDALIKSYYEEKRAFKEAHPCPVEVVNYCSGEYPMYALSVDGTGRTASRGYPELITGLGISDSEINPLRNFLLKYDLKPDPDKPEGWYLSSYWG